MSEPIKRRGMSGKDVITVGIFSAIYFVINFAFMLLGRAAPAAVDSDARLHRPCSPASRIS